MNNINRTYGKMGDTKTNSPNIDIQTAIKQIHDQRETIKQCVHSSTRKDVYVEDGIKYPIWVCKSCGAWGDRITNYGLISTIGDD